MTSKERQNAMMDFIDEFWYQHHYSPSTREIMDACQISSTSVVRYTLGQLQEAGHLTYLDDIARSIVPTWVALTLAEKA